MLQECRRILKLGDQMLLDAPDVELDDARALDALVFAAVATASSAAQPASNSAASSAAQPATSSATHPVGAPSSSTPQSGAAQPVVCESEARDLGDNSANPVRRSELPDGPSPFLDTAAGEAAEDISDTINDLEITTLTNTTSLHDDWLHRGPFSGRSRLTHLHRPRRSHPAPRRGSSFRHPALPGRVSLR